MKVELGCTYNGGGSKPYPPYSPPPPLLTVCQTDSAAGLKEGLMPCHCLPPLFLLSRADNEVVPSVKKKWKGRKKRKHLYVPSVIVSSNRHQQANFSVLPYRWTHSWENVFFFLRLVGAMASPFFLGLTGLVVPVLPRLSRYCLLPISLLGL